MRNNNLIRTDTIQSGPITEKQILDGRPEALQSAGALLDPAEPQIVAQLLEERCAVHRGAHDRSMRRYVAPVQTERHSR